MYLGNYFMFCISQDTLEIKDTHISIDLFKTCTYIVKTLIKILSLKRKASKHLLAYMSLYIYKQVWPSKSKPIKKIMYFSSKQGGKWMTCLCHCKSEYDTVQTSTCTNLLINLWGLSVVIDRNKHFLPHRCDRLKIKAPSSRRKIKTTTYSILHLYIWIIIKQIDKAASHQLLHENSISYVKSFSNTIIWDGNKDSYIYNGYGHLTIKP